MDYQHIYCDSCGGVIGMFDREKFTCERCGKEFSLHSLSYDRLNINDKTGWIFPVIEGCVDMNYQEAIKLLKKANRSNDMVCILPKSDISKVIISSLQELQKLYSIGTAEELREAVEKQKAKKPLLGGNTDKITGDIRICPCCCGIVGMDDMRADFCADCGQHIDWSEVEE